MRDERGVDFPYQGDGQELWFTSDHQVFSESGPLEWLVANEHALDLAMLGRTKEVHPRSWAGASMKINSRERADLLLGRTELRPFRNREALVVGGRRRSLLLYRVNPLRHPFGSSLREQICQ